MNGHDSSQVDLPADLGFRILPPGALEHVREIVALAQERVQSVDPETLDPSGPRVKWGLLDVDALTTDSPIVKLGTHPSVVAAITQYLGAVPLLWSVDIWASYSRNAPVALTDSEIFHCDWDAISQVKVFIQCSEVDHENGPLVLLNAAKSREVRERLGYDYGARVSDEVMDSFTVRSDHTVVLGPPGTVAFVDTSQCFHYGSRVSANAKPRVMTMFQYVIPSAFVLPLDYERRAPLRRLASPSMNKIQRLVLGAT